MTADIPWEAWLRRENKWRRDEGLDPLDPDSPALLHRRLEDYGDNWRAKAALKRWAWVTEGWLDGYLAENEWYAEMDEFIQEAQALIANEEAIANYRLLQTLMADDRPLTASEQARRAEWQRSEAERQERMELRKQRAALKEGRHTLTLIRKHLQGPASSRRQASRPERTSPTS
jgi:hypothetical protein